MPPASPTPSLTLTVDDLVGFWRRPPGHIQFRPDGTFAFRSWAPDEESLIMGDYRLSGKYRVEGDLLYIQEGVAGYAGCAVGPFASYRLMSKSQDQLEFTGVEVICNKYWPEDFSMTRVLPKGTEWAQIERAPFSTPQNAVLPSLSIFDDSAGNRGYFLGTLNPAGAQVWRKPVRGSAEMGGGWTWAARTMDGFGVPANTGVSHLFVFDDRLYAGTLNETAGGEVWRTANGTQWEQVVSAGFGDAANGEVVRLIEFDSQLYAGTRDPSGKRGAQIWRSETGDAGSWQVVVADGLGDPNNQSIPVLEVFDGALFAGTLNPITGPQVWRSADGAEWTPVTVDGFGLGSAAADRLAAFVVFGDKLYAATAGLPDGAAGVDVWRCQACDGGDWARVVESGFGNPEASGSALLAVHKEALYLVMGNRAAGLEVWRTATGTEWEQSVKGGFGNPNNVGASAILSAQGRLLVGTHNEVDGGQLWVYVP